MFTPIFNMRTRCTFDGEDNSPISSGAQSFRSDHNLT